MRHAKYTGTMSRVLKPEPDRLSVPALDWIACFTPPKRDIAPLAYDASGHLCRKPVLYASGLTCTTEDTGHHIVHSLRKYHCVRGHTLDMTTSVQQNLVRSNDAYAASFDKGDLALPPAKKYLVVTCMDARIEPAAAFGISLGDAHVIRNAGGNAKDALRSILISQSLLGTNEVVLIKHTGCGMLTFANEDAKAAVKSQGGKLEHDFDFQPFPDLDVAVKEDVAWLKQHEALPRGIEFSGWVYAVATGKIRRVV